MLSLKVLVIALVGAVTSREVGIPERFLRPRDFNPHPFLSEEGTGESPPLPEVHPYALFRRPPLRGEDDGAPIQFPKVPDAVPPPRNQPRPQQPSPIANAIQVQPLKRPHYNIAKNYAFSYTVRDHQSGDDFSHSQAHSGEATKGEYRVKLPDGRVQVVSYTADHRGYRADVRYDNEVGEDYSKAHNKVPTYKQSSFKAAPVYKQVAYKPYKSALYYPVDYPDYGVEYARPQKDYTPIHEDYPEDEDEVEEPSASPAPEAYYSPSPQPYATASPPPHYEEYHIVTTPSPSPAKFVVLPARISPIH